MRGRLVISGIAFCCALAGLVFAHARWMARAPRDPRFVRFMRRNNLRANANEVIPERGKAVDPQGRPLDIAEAGSTFQKVVDELQLARVGVDDVRMRVAERRHHHPSCGIDHTVGIHLLQLAHRPKSLYLAVLYEQVGILDGLQLSHLLALLAQLRGALHSH